MDIELLSRTQHEFWAYSEHNDFENGSRTTSPKAAMSWKGIKDRVRSALTKPPPYYFWVSLALFAGVATLGTCGVVYYVGLVTAGNISGANSVALTSARELEKLLGDQKGPILSVAQQIELNPHWPSFNAKFEALAVTIAQNYYYYEIEADPSGIVAAMYLPWQNLTGKELLDWEIDNFDYGLDILSPYNRPGYWVPWVEDLDSISQNGSIYLIGPWQGPSDILFGLRYSVFLNTTNASEWERPQGTGGIEACPQNICNRPDGSTLWGLVNSVFSCQLVVDGLSPVISSGLLYSLAPDPHASNQSFLAISKPAPRSASHCTCTSVDVYSWLTWTLCVDQPGGWRPAWASGAIAAAFMLAMLLAVLVFLVLRSRSQAMYYLAIQRETNRQLSFARGTQHALLSDIFPRHVVEFLSEDRSFSRPLSNLARSHKQVTILFMDIAGFTNMSKSVEPTAILIFLNQLFTMFDYLVQHHNIMKVETIGDCYIVAGGIMESDGQGFYQVTDSSDPVENARKVMAFAKDMLRCSKEVRMPHNNEVVDIRIGIHTGDCVTGLVGTKLPKFSIYGDTMNTASRMESTGTVGHIHISSSTYALLISSSQTSIEHPLLEEDLQWVPSGGVEVKGKGCMETYLWKMPKGFLERPLPEAALSTQTQMAFCLDRQSNQSYKSHIKHKGDSTVGSNLEDLEDPENNDAIRSSHPVGLLGACSPKQQDPKMLTCHPRVAQLMKTPTPLWKHGYIITGGGSRRDINSHGDSPCTPGPQTHNTISINPGLLAMCQQSAATWARQAEDHADHGTPTGTSRMAEHHADHGTPTGTSRMAAGTSQAAHTSRLHPDSLNPSSNPPPQAMSVLFSEPSTHHPDYASDAYRTGSLSLKESLDKSRRTPPFSVGSNHDYVPFSAQVPEIPVHSATGSGQSATDTGHSATGRGHSTTGTPTGSTFSSPSRPVLRNLPSPTWVNIPEAGVGSVAVDSRVADEGGLTGGGLEAWIPFTSLMRRGPLPSILQPSIMSRSSARGAAVLQAALPSAIHLERLPTSPLTQVWSTAADQDTPTHSAPLSKVLLPCTSAVPDDFDGGCVLRDNDRDSSMDQDVRMTLQLEQRSKLHAVAPSLAVHASVAQKGTAAAATIRMDKFESGLQNRLLLSPSVLNDSRRGGLNVSRTGNDEGGDYDLKGYELPHVQVLLSSDDHGCRCEVETLNPKPSKPSQEEDRRVDEGLNAAALASGTQRERHDTISGGCIPGRIMSVQESPSEMQRILFLK